jgi:pimeloyl-ACP methyl ester carboxylesterase
MSRWLVAVLTTPMFLLVVTQAVLGGAKDETVPDPPGKLVDLGGRRLHVTLTGAGTPTVVMENGAGAFSTDWALVVPKVAAFARVMAYDRAGYAWSDRGPTQDTIEQTIDDLNLLLRKANVRPPYVLVGASLGCAYVRAYQRRFPEQVVGLVFVDGTHDEFITFMVDGQRKPIIDLSATELQGAYPNYEREAPRPKLGAADQPPLDRLPVELQKARHWAMGKLIGEVGLLPKGVAAAESWRQEFTALRRQRTGAQYPLGDLPLIALERSEDSNERWHAQQLELAALSRAGKLVRVEDSGHMIHLYRPDSVAQAIQDVIIAAQSKQGH